MTPSSQGIHAKQLQYNDVSTSSVAKNHKEPRFVPYEPYKAAVHPLVKSKGKAKQLKTDENIQPLVNTEFQSQQTKNFNQTNDKGEEFKVSEGNVSSGEIHLVTESNLSSSQVTVESVTLESLRNTEKMLDEANKRLSEAEKQLRIQIQVILYTLAFT